jgi:hypothetical protein
VKPSVTIDERGVLLHVTTEAGEGVAIPLAAETVVELIGGLTRARVALMQPKGRKIVLRALGAAFLELTKPGDGNGKG